MKVGRRKPYATYSHLFLNRFNLPIETGLAGAFGNSLFEFLKPSFSTNLFCEPDKLSFLIETESANGSGPQSTGRVPKRASKRSIKVGIRTLIERFFISCGSQ